MLITSDMPVTKKGSWFLEYEHKCDSELIELIQGTVYEVWRVEQKIKALIAQGKTIPAWLRSQLRTLNRDLCRMRSVATYYREASTIYNMQVLGEAFINQLNVTCRRSRSRPVYCVSASAFSVTVSIRR